jgi:DNA-binding XRE family transcriptional regulator
LRLRRLRNAFGFETVRDFEAFLNVNEQTWYHCERGRRVPTIHDAIKVAKKTDVSLDWIYMGLDHTCRCMWRRRSPPFQKKDWKD